MNDSSNAFATKTASEKHSKLLHSLIKIKLRLTTETIDNAPAELTVQELFNEFGSLSHWLIIALFVLPFMQPVPMFGLSTLSGSLIFFVGLNLLQNRKPWIPEKIATKKIPNKHLLVVINTAEKVWFRLEKFIHPRLPKFSRSRLLQITQILIVWILAVLLALPLPIPASNIIPAVPIFLIALGHIEEDFFLIFFADLLALFAIGFFIALGIGANKLGQYFL